MMRTIIVVKQSKNIERTEIPQLSFPGVHVFMETVYRPDVVVRRNVKFNRIRNFKNKSFQSCSRKRDVRPFFSDNIFLWPGHDRCKKKCRSSLTANAVEITLSLESNHTQDTFIIFALHKIWCKRRTIGSPRAP